MSGEDLEPSSESGPEADPERGLQVPTVASEPDPDLGPNVAPVASERDPDLGLHVRPPTPIPARTRLVIGAVAAVVAIIGAVLIVSAQSDDGGTHPGANWDGHPLPPRGAKVDGFEVDGLLGEIRQVEGFGAWTAGTAFANEGGLLVATGTDSDQPATSRGAFDDSTTGGASTTAWVDSGSTNVLVVAQVVDAPPGTRLVISHPRPGAPQAVGVWLVAAADGRWVLVQGSAASPQEVATFEAPTSGVAIQVVRQEKVVKVQFDQRGIQAVVVEPKPGETWVGIGAPRGAGSTARLDLFGYLPLPAG